MTIRDEENQLEILKQMILERSDPKLTCHNLIDHGQEGHSCTLNTFKQKSLHRRNTIKQRVETLEHNKQVMLQLKASMPDIRKYIK